MAKTWGYQRMTSARRAQFAEVLAANEGLQRWRALSDKVDKAQHVEDLAKDTDR